MLINLIISLFLTIIIELIISLILGIRKRNDIYVVILVNICTNPVIVYIANLISTECSELIYNIIVMIMEIVGIIINFLK